jgi:hypothetical protein
MTIITNNTLLTAAEIESKVSEFSDFFAALNPATGQQFFAVGSDGKLIGTTELSATIIVAA